MTLDAPADTHTIPVHFSTGRREAAPKKGSLLDGVMEASAFAALQQEQMPKDRGQQVEENIRGEALRMAWQECTDSLKISTPAERRECMTGVATLRTEFLTALNSVSDADDRTLLSTIFYIHLKSQWISLNLWSGYRMAAGKPDELLQCRLGMMAALLDRVEKALSPSDVASVGSLLAHPVSRPALGGDVLQPLSQKNTADLPSVSRDNKQKMQEMQDALAAQEGEMGSRRASDAALIREFGTTNASIIVARYNETQTKLAALGELQELMGGVESFLGLADY